MNGVRVQPVKQNERGHAMKQQLFRPLEKNALVKKNNIVHVLRSQTDRYLDSIIRQFEIIAIQ